MTTHEEHEALCRCCGRCCYEKLIVDGCVFTTRRPCAYLDGVGKRCRVYARRHKVNPRCLTVAEGIRYGVFPAQCPYVVELPDYRPAEEGWLDAEVVGMIERGEIHRADEIRAEIMRRQGGLVPGQEEVSRKGRIG